MTGTHLEHEDFPWTIAVVDHPSRTDSPGYRASRTLMNKLAATVPEWTFGPGPFEDHHGGAVWVKDDTGWLCLTLPLGIEWSAQFCADPAKVDRLRQLTARIVAAFPATLPGYVESGYNAGEQLLTTAITTADQVAAWTDSIYNASLPLPVGTHTGVLPTGAGYHHYPKPIVDIDHFRYDDFQPFVNDSDGRPAVVVPVAPRGSGDGRVMLLAAQPGSSYADRLFRSAIPAQQQAATELATDSTTQDARPDVLDEDDPLALSAFARQR